MPPRLPPALAPLRDQAERAAVLLDFDGTLAPIVADPAAARPLPGVAPLLAELGRRFGLVAVVSGRPVAFLHAALDDPPGVRLVGLYGMEHAAAGSGVWRSPEAVAWRPAVDAAAGRARSSAPAGVEIEEKGLTVTLHWRRAPQAAAWGAEFADQEAARSGLVAQPGRMAVELRPPVAGDKGTVVGDLGQGFQAVAFFGDDLGDLPAFAALGRLAAGGAAVARVAVVDDESPPEVAAAADVVVRGAPGAVALLRQLAGPA